MANKALARAFITLLLVLPIGVVAAQDEAAKPAGIKLEEGSKPDAQKPEPKPVKTASGKVVVHMFDDARHCLDMPTIAEIIKCAEPYRY